ncbi:MAG: RNA polymerase sigma factor [Candidatus Geothermincolia bacterium]
MNQIESDMNNSSSTLLLAEESLEEIYSVYNRKVYGYFRRNGFDHEAAEDLAQEVFCRLLRFKDTFESNDQIRNWIFKVARNLLIDVLRKKENGAARPILMEDLPSFDTLVMDYVHVDGPEQTFVTEESNTEVMNLIEALNPRYADVIRLRELEGLKYQEIAKELGMTPKAVEGLLHRARAKLKTSYAAFQKSYQGAIAAIFAITLRGLRRSGGKSAKTEQLGAAGDIAGTGKATGLGSLLSGNGILNGLLAVLVVGGITAGGMAIGLSETAPAQAPRATSEVTSPLGELLALQLAPEMMEFSGLTALDLDALPTELSLAGLLPIIDELLGVLTSGELPGLENAVHELLAGIDVGVDSLLGVVDSLVSGLGGTTSALLDLLATMPGLDLLSTTLNQVSATAASLDGSGITAPVDQLQDQLFAAVEGAVGPVLGTVDGVLRQAQPVTTAVTAPLAPVTGALGGLLTPLGLKTASEPEPQLPDDFMPLPEVQPGEKPASEPMAPESENAQLIGDLLAPVLNGLLGL